MEEPNKVHGRFYRYWTRQRKNKVRYLLVQGVGYWFVLSAIFVLTSKTIHFEFGSPVRLALKILFIAGAGILWGHYSFRRNERIYQQYIDGDKEIDNGVLALENDKVWTYENLTFELPEENRLLVRNNLFWLEEENPNEKQVTACLQSLVEDVKRIRLNKKMNAFADGKKILLRLYSNSDQKNPLTEQYL